MHDWRTAIDQLIDGMAGELTLMRRHLHENPELSGSEFETTQFVSRRLKDLGIKHQIVNSSRGVVADSNGSEPAVAFRADMDALKIQDQKKVEYRSQNAGLMHACGHDAHTTIGYAVARTLSTLRDQLPWPTHWRAVFQPSEETGEGAKEMIAAGAIEGIKSMIALHVWPDLPAGEIGIRRGALTACCQGIDVTIRGAGGHSARPHETDDAIAVAAQFINTVLTSVPRSIDARDPAVVSFGAIQGGGGRGAIPDSVIIRGTVRATTEKQRQNVEMYITRIAEHLTQALRRKSLEIHVDFLPGVAAVENDPFVNSILEEAAVDAIGSRNVIELEKPSMGGEDFGNYLGEKVRGSMFRLGITSERIARHDLHSPQFDLDEKALVCGAKVMARAVVLLCRPDDWNGKPA